jgi:hypothetical protein
MSRTHRKNSEGGCLVRAVSAHCQSGFCLAGGIAGPSRPGPGPLPPKPQLAELTPEGWEKGVAAPLWKPPPAAKADQAKRPEAASGWAGLTDRRFPIDWQWEKSGHLPHAIRIATWGPGEGSGEGTARSNNGQPLRGASSPAGLRYKCRSLSGGLRPLYRRCGIHSGNGAKRGRNRSLPIPTLVHRSTLASVLGPALRRAQGRR